MRSRSPERNSAFRIPLRAALRRASSTAASSTSTPMMRAALEASDSPRAPVPQYCGHLSVSRRSEQTRA